MELKVLAQPRIGLWPPLDGARAAIGSPERPRPLRNQYRPGVRTETRLRGWGGRTRTREPEYEPCI
jgi:hypothetical protein